MECYSKTYLCVFSLQPGALDFNNQLLAPGGKGMWGSWGKGSSGGSGAKPASGDQGRSPPSNSMSWSVVLMLSCSFAFFFFPPQDSGRSTTSTLNRFSALQQSGSLLSSTDSDRRVPQRYSATPYYPDFVLVFSRHFHNFESEFIKFQIWS